MRQLVLLAALYAVAVALVLPSSLFASDQPPTETEATAPATEEPAIVEEPAAEPAPEETTPAEPAPAPQTQTAPAPVPAPPTVTAPAAPPPAAEQPPAEPAEPVTAADNDDEPQGKQKKTTKKKNVRARAAADQRVTISDYQFTPATITVQQGDEVTWTNDGPSSHSATADDGSFDTGVFGAGGSRSVTFDDAGTFSYICTPHPNMKGTVTVQAAGSVGQAEEDLQDAEEDLAAAEDDVAAAGGLPDTGRDARVVGLTGLLMLALGGVLRLRARARA